MAWSDTGDFTSGQILTAAAMDKVREAMFFGQATFTNEAARDTAFANPGALAPITLQEGMRAYLTASTVAAATGATFSTAPTGITTVYNGSVWVCTTPVVAKSNTSATTTSSSYVTTLTSDATAVSVTLVTGTTALVVASLNVEGSAAGQNLFFSISVSGATTVAAADSAGHSVTAGGNGYRHSVNRTQVISGLTAGTNTFTLNYKAGTGTLTALTRDLMVIGIA
jgi:hypothetical protein